MTKKTSVIVLAIVAVIVVLLGVFACLPINVANSGHNVYISPLSRIQGSRLFGDNVNAVYSVNADSDEAWDNISSVIRTRMADIYGFYGCSVSLDKDAKTVTVSAPEISTVVKNENGIKVNVDRDNTVLVQSYIENAVAGGKVEISGTAYSGSSVTYSESDIVLKPEHFKRNASISRYVNGDTVWHLVDVKLTAEGKTAAKSLSQSTSTSYPVFIDEELAAYVFKTGDASIQIYTGSETAARTVASYVNNDVIDAELTLDVVEADEAAGAIIFVVVFALLVVACWVVFILRFKALGVAGIYSQLIAIVLFIIAMGLVGVEIFNLAAAVGAILAYGLMTFITYKSLADIAELAQSKTFASASYKGFAANNKLNIIAHAAVVVLGAILWLIPTVVTAPLGNVLVYATVLSFGATMGLNRLFVGLVASIVGNSAKVGK